VCLTVRAGDLIDQAAVIDRDTIEVQLRIRLSPGSGSLGDLKNTPDRAIQSKISNSYK
jgi:hypothetical protein